MRRASLEGMSVRQLQKLECHGKSNPTVRTLAAVCGARRATSSRLECRHAACDCWSRSRRTGKAAHGRGARRYAGMKRATAGLARGEQVAKKPPTRKRTHLRSTSEDRARLVARRWRDVIELRIGPEGVRPPWSRRTVAPTHKRTLTTRPSAPRSKRRSRGDGGIAKRRPWVASASTRPSSPPNGPHTPAPAAASNVVGDRRRESTT